ncbi:UNVERIFIED_CONTAM: DNA repair protein REV1, partial [Sesamum radiatum]
TGGMRDDEASGQPCSNITGSSVEAGAALSSSVIGVSQTANLPLFKIWMSLLLNLFLQKWFQKLMTCMAGGYYVSFPNIKARPSIPPTLHCPKVVKEMQCCEEAPASVAVSASFSSRNLMPSSLSQVDCSVLQQLPDELRKDIIELLPPHREPEFVQGASSNVVDEQNEFAASDLSDLWIGSPPKWVEKFRISPCSILNNFAEMYRPVCGDGLSSLLQRIISGLILQIEVATHEFDDAVSWISELLKQYLDLNISTDIEEIYFCICLLRR